MIANFTSVFYWGRGVQNGFNNIFILNKFRLWIRLNSHIKYKYESQYTRIWDRISHFQAYISKVAAFIKNKIGGGGVCRHDITEILLKVALNTINRPFRFVCWLKHVEIKSGMLKCSVIVISLIWAGFMVFKTTFNNISAMSWRSVLLMEETGVHREENHRSVASHWQTFIT